MLDVVEHSGEAQVGGTTTARWGRFVRLGRSYEAFLVTFQP